ncbi:hypothetical protein BKA61DRAFT_566120 [Leptodontidium sp. MPI-SDFR-AT-0119]|nr:hypothetical protein BKA61DRAFT_566120 [Leptodontidium sp. MPI-SDFR-AT-0119]
MHHRPGPGHRYLGRYGTPSWLAFQAMLPSWTCSACSSHLISGPRWGGTRDTCVSCGFGHSSFNYVDVWPAEGYRSCYRVKWLSRVMLPENRVAMLDVHKATALYDENIQLDRLDGMELESMDHIMLLTALSKGVVYGLLLNKRVVSGDMPEYERVGFINGLDAIGDLSTWSSSYYSSEPMFTEDWEPEDSGGITAILEYADIERSTMKIW